ncbi:LytTR family DNA-binding domain-containing protein [Puia sp.]|jgi:DNA-binding LytR/AlgR family response regulator|uniref:LytR/AlgR family response regulator transcription factor n=1 Tax=Puia sp. TaxID=2045100 RepID=UPI002F4301F0
MRVLIIEDERKAAQELKTLVLGLRPDWYIVGVLPSASETIEWLRENKSPDLIFSDIQLADAVCFRIFETVEVKCPIIFCTAFDEYAIKAFETSGIDYLLKPVDKLRLERSLQKLDNLRSSLSPGGNPNYPDIGRLIEHLTPPTGKTILVHHKEKIIPVNHADIAFFYYDKGVVTIKLLNGASYHLNQGIDELEKSTDPRLFYRANRQFIVNRNAIRDIEKFFARKLVVKLDPGAPETVVISKARASDFLGWLENGHR